MNQPQKPKDPPTKNPAGNQAGTTADVVPDGAADQEPKGMPTSDRHKTETEPHQ